MFERTPRIVRAYEKDKPTPLQRIAIITKELGLVAYRIVLIEKGLDKDVNRALKADLKTDGGQLLLQVKMLLLDLGIQYEEAEKMAIDETLDVKFKEFEAKNWGMKKCK